MSKDFETRIMMLTQHLKEEKVKKYSDKCETNSVYIFNNYSEYRNYFTNNGFDIIEFDDIEKCKIKTTRNGKVIVSKYLCDNEIKKGKQKIKKI